jgi:hypothetical protein
MYHSICRTGLAIAVGLLLTLRAASVRAGEVPAKGSSPTPSAVSMSQSAVPDGATLSEANLFKAREDAAPSSSTSASSSSLGSGDFPFSSPAEPTLRVGSDNAALRSLGSTYAQAHLGLANDNSARLSLLQEAAPVSNLRRDATVAYPGVRLSSQPRLAQSNIVAVGTAAHGKLSFLEKLNTFRIGRLGHAASVAVLGTIVGSAVALAIVIPLTQ